MMVIGQPEDRQNPQGVWALKARYSDWESISGCHQGQRSSRPHQQAGHMTASDHAPITLRKTLPARDRPHMTPFSIFLSLMRFFRFFTLKLSHSNASSQGFGLPMDSMLTKVYKCPFFYPSPKEDLRMSD